MATNTLNTRMKQRIDTASNWSSTNPVLSKGEIGLVFSANNSVMRYKIGDGVTAWNSLIYQDEIANINGLQAALLGKEPSFVKNTAFNKSFGSAAGTVCEGNDARLSNARTPTAHTHTKANITDFPTSLPASDVYSWAKASTKPSYTYSEVGAAASNHNHAGIYEPIFVKNSAFNKNFGSAVDTVCQGNDARLSNARPASDVYAWAKAATKPSYSYSEVGAAAASHSHSYEAPITAGSTSQYWRGDKTWVTFPTSLPASDVYAWAKASTKPSYTKSEVGLGNVDNTADANKSVNYASSAGNANTVDSKHIWTGTQAAYNAIGTKDSNTLYFITG